MPCAPNGVVRPVEICELGQEGSWDSLLTEGAPDVLICLAPKKVGGEGCWEYKFVLPQQLRRIAKNVRYQHVYKNKSFPQEPLV